MNLKLTTCVGLSLILGFSTSIKAQWNNVGTNPITPSSAAYTNLVKDNSGNYYVSYYSGGIPLGSVQKFNGTSWSPLGGTLGITPGFATYNALCVNTSGEVYYSFQDGSNSNGLSVKKYSPGTNTWTDAGVNISNGVVNYQNIKIIPSSGLPVAMYNSSGIKAKRYTGTSWVDVGAAPVVTGAGANHSMVVGTNDTVYVAVQVGNAYSVYKNHINASTSDAWQLVGNQGYISGSNSGQFIVSLAIDASNKLYMAYRGLTSPDGNKVSVYKYDGTSWAALGNTAFSSYEVEHISIAVTPAGIPTVAVRENNPTDKTKVFTLNGATWTSLGTPSTNLGNFNSLIMDGSDPVVAFCDGTGVSGGLVTVKKYNPIVVNADSIDVTTVGSVAAAISTNGGSLPMQAVFYPSTTSNQNVTWSIAPGTGTASISATGVVTALTNGTVYAKAVSVADPTKFDSLQITISGQIVDLNSIQVLTQNNVPASINTNAGTLQMEVLFFPANATNQNITWSIVPVTGNASISGTGLVTASANGTVYAKAVSVANTSLMDSLLITIAGQTIEVDSIKVRTENNVAAAIDVNGGTLQMEALFFPGNASNQNVTWSIVPVSGAAGISADGVVTAQANGTVYAKAVSNANNSLSDSLLINITNQGLSIRNGYVTSNFALFPSPASTQLTLEAKTPEKFDYKIYNASGQLMMSGSASRRTVLDIAQMAAGMYSLQIATEHGPTGAIQFIKQ